MAGGTALPEKILARFRGVALERLERIEAGWLELTRFPDDGERADEIRRELHTLKGDARVVAFTEVASLCHKLEDLLFFAHGRRYQVPENFDLVVTMAMRFIAILVRHKEGSTPTGIDLGGFGRQIDEVLRDAQTFEAPAAESTNKRRGTHSSSVRERMDRLSFATLHSFAEAATAVYLEHLLAAEPGRSRLRKVWEGLRDLIASLQTVPLTPDLARRARSAAELGRDLKKKVDLVLELEDVQVPPAVAEAIGTAALHALRNAVDHGIEAPEVRIASGKKLEGTLHVRARRLGEMVEVVIEDDGGGIDLDAVRKRGVELGLLPRGGEAVPERTVFELLFEPGFSTHKDVDETSGRGVGLDAARSALSRLGGSIDLHTRAGAGTTVLMRAPLQSLHLEVLLVGEAAGVPIAVPAVWGASAEPNAAPTQAIDPYAFLGLGAGGSGTVLRLEKESTAVRILGASLGQAAAERLCPTGDYHPVEVIRIAGGEALLLHPSALTRPPDSDARAA